MNILSIILAAGKGNRMKSNIPKPFHKIANLKMIDWVINVNKSINVSKFVHLGTPEQYEDYRKWGRYNLSLKKPIKKKLESI